MFVARIVFITPKLVALKFVKVFGISGSDLVGVMLRHNQYTVLILESVTTNYCVMSFPGPICDTFRTRAVT